jgi:hypothetical protein
LAKVPSYCLVVTANVARVEGGDGSSREILAQLIESALSTLRLWLPDSVLGVYLERQFEQAAIARVSPAIAPLPADGYSLELRFASWLATLGAPGVKAVPTFLYPWLPLAKALVIPLFVDGHHRGVMVVQASTLGRRQLSQLEQLAAEIEVTLAEHEHSAPQGMSSVRCQFANSVRRIKTSTQP